MSKKRETRDGIRDILVQLGGDIETVKTRLWASGVRGTPNSAEDCVVARYLHAVVAGDRAVLNVHVRRKSVRINFASFRVRSIVLGLPAPLQDFIASFDNGEILDLVDSRHATTNRVTGSPDSVLNED
jgi:hypothetical protein